MMRYETEQRSNQHGTGTFTHDFVRYQEPPSHIAAKLTEEAKPHG